MTAGCPFTKQSNPEVQPRRENRYASELSKRLDQIIATASNNQNFVTSQEIESAGERFFAAVDTDGNGAISTEEFAVFQGIRDQPANRSSWPPGGRRSDWRLSKATV